MSATDAPRAPFRPQTTELHGETRVDGYGYLKDREDADTIPYLNAENAHVEAAMADTETLQEDLFKEFLSRIEEEDTKGFLSDDSSITTEPKKKSPQSSVESLSKKTPQKKFSLM